MRKTDGMDNIGVKWADFNQLSYARELSQNGAGLRGGRKLDWIKTGKNRVVVDDDGPETIPAQPLLTGRTDSGGMDSGVHRRGHSQSQGHRPVGYR